MTDSADSCDLAVVGAGIVGLAAAREVLERRGGRGSFRVCVLERAHRVGTGQTGANSGVVHSGLYYAPGSQKARLCVEGAAELFAYCAARGLPHARTGKLVLATDRGELGRLAELERRGRANGVALERLGPAGIADHEQHAAGVAALWSPSTGTADFAAVARELAADVEAAGGEVVLSTAVRGVEGGERGGVVLRHARGALVARRALFCVGHAADRLAVAAGAGADPRIVPFRGAYGRLVPARQALVRGLIYPVPDPRLPFLGVHLTRHADAEVLVGPTALLVPGRHALTWPGTWRLGARFWRAGLGELALAIRPGALARAAARLVPALGPDDVDPGWAGTRAQAVARSGGLIDDFAFSETPGALHVRNAPSPAATAALAIARVLADALEGKAPK